MIKEVQKGNRAAYRIIVEKYQKQVAGVVIGMLGHGPEADDVGQHTFIRFYKSLDQFRGDASLGTYITRIAINLCLNEIKKNKRTKSWLNKNQSDIATLGNALEDTSVDNTGLEVLQKAVFNLGPKHRIPVVLKYFQGLTINEIAEILHIPPGTVISRLSRAQGKLKLSLTPHRELIYG